MESVPTMPAGVTPETALLLSSVRAASGVDGGHGLRFDPATPDRAPDLHRLYELALRHRLVAPLLESLTVSGPEVGIDDAALAPLRAQAEAIARQNLLLAGELLRVLRVLGRAGIRALPMKGPVLADRLYGNLAGRAFGDLDVLVRPEDVGIATTMLLGTGYEAPLEMTPVLEELAIRFEYDRSFVHEESGSHLELHWHFFDRAVAFTEEDEAFWSTLERRTFLEQKIDDLPAADLLAYLAVHGAKHGWAQLGWSLDIARLVATQKVDWPAALAAVGLRHCRRAVLVALGLAEALWGCVLPEPAREAVHGDAAAARVVRRIIDTVVVAERPIETERDAVGIYLASRERFRDRMLFLWCWLTVPSRRDRAFVTLPPAAAFLYIFVRPLRLLRDLVRRSTSA